MSASLSLRSLRVPAVLSLALLAPLAVQAGKKAPPPPPAPEPAPAPAPEPDWVKELRASLDPAVSPCDDFYRYACGGWMDGTQIPADKVWWDRSFSQISDRNELMLRDILEGAAKDAGGDPVLARVGAYYGACMNEDAISALGATPLAPMLTRISAVKKPADALKLAGELSMGGVSGFYNMEVYADFTDPNLNIAHMTQGGLGLPDREYYLSTDEQMVGLRAAYKAHIAKMLSLAGVTAADADKQADLVIAFETKLAEFSIPRDQLRDPEKTYHKLDRKGLQALSPKFPWDAHFAAMGYPNLDQINVEVPDFFSQMGALVLKTKKDTLQAYLRWHLVSDMASQLSPAFEQENFAFYGQTLFGQAEMKPRWKRCIDATESAMGEVLGQAYVAKAFAGDSKTVAVEMIQGIEGAFEAGLPSVAWMDDATRAKAVEKAKAVSNKIGFPDHWRDFSNLSVNATDYFGSAWNANVFNSKYYLDKVGGAVDRGEWFMSPHVVNAYYNPLNNEIVFPAGILQPPFFSADYPRAMNYGAIGMVMGHELTHGFDDGGRKFDPQGRMVAWWAEDASTRFEEASQCIVGQYNGYEVQPGLNLNGELTLGENIADHGGIKAAYRAYKAWEAANPGAAEPIEGFSNDQLFFLAFAQGWCSLVREETERVMVRVDSHSPAKFRVNGPLVNFPAFAEAFSCEEGKPMRPAEACTVW